MNTTTLLFSVVNGLIIMIMESFDFGNRVVWLVDSDELSSALVKSILRYYSCLLDFYSPEVALEKFVKFIAIDVMLTVRVSVK